MRTDRVIQLLDIKGIRPSIFEEAIPHNKIHVKTIAISVHDNEYTLSNLSLVSSTENIIELKTIKQLKQYKKRGNINE